MNKLGAALVCLGCIGGLLAEVALPVKSDGGLSILLTIGGIWSFLTAL